MGVRGMLAAAVLAAMVAGCAGAAHHAAQEAQMAQPINLSAAQVQGLHVALRKVLKDPDSAKFGGHSAAKASDGMIWICGTVNAKNSYGGYTGMRPYIGGIESGITGIAKIASDDLDIRLVTQMCAQKGVVFSG